MTVGDETALLMLDIIKMVEIASNWLDTEQCNHGGTQKSVILAKVLRLQLARVQTPKGDREHDR